VCAVH